MAPSTCDRVGGTSKSSGTLIVTSRGQLTVNDRVVTPVNGGTRISFVDSCPPTGLTVLDNWVFGFGWIRWVSLLLSGTSECNSFIQ